MSLVGTISRVVAWTVRRPRLTLLCAALVAVAAALGLRTARIDSSLTAMLGTDNATAAALARIADHFQSAESMIVLVAAPAETPPESARAMLVDYAQRLAKSVRSAAGAAEFVESVDYQTRSAFDAYIRDVVIPHGVVYLDEANFRALLDRLQPDQVRAQLEQDEAMLAAPGPQAGALARELVKDPLRLRDFFRDRIGAALDGGGLWLSDDGRALLVRISGRRPVSDITFSKQFTALVEAAIAATESGALEVSLGGGYAIAATSAAAIRSDAITSTLSSVGLLLAFFFIAYRGPVAAVQIAVAAALGIFAAFSLYVVFAGTLTPLTAVIAAMLAGLGVDYAIHFRAQYTALTLAGACQIEAARRSMRELALPMFGAFITTVIGFGTVALADVKMLRDFALLGCLGLAGALCSVCLVLPALLQLTRPAHIQSPTQRLVGWYVRAMAAAPARPLAGAAALLVASIAAIALTPGLAPPFEANSAVMHPQPNAPMETQQRVQDRFAAAGARLVVYLTADTPRELVEQSYAVRRVLSNDAARSAGVTATRGLADVLPDPEQAEARLRDLAGLDADSIIAAVSEAIAASNFQPGAFDDYLAQIRSALTDREGPGAEDLRAHPEIAQLFLPELSATPPADARVEAVVHVEVAADARDEAAMIAALRDLLAPVPGATLTGVAVVSHDLQRLARRDLGIFSGVSIALVVVWLAVMFRRPLDVLLALTPVAFALCIVAGSMSLLGQRLNIVNVAAMPLLAGIAVDCGIFLVSTARARNDSRASLESALPPTLHAIFCTGVTTALGFGTLIWTRTPAVQSLGVAALLGITASTIAAAALLAPLLLYRSSARRKDEL